MNKQIVVLSALLGVSLIGSYLSWTSEDGTDADDTIVILDGKPEGIASIAYTADKLTVEMEARADERGAWVWVTTTEQKRKAKPPKSHDDDHDDHPEPPPVEPPLEGGPDVSPADGEEASEEPVEAVPEEPEYEDLTKTFKAGSSGDDLLADLAPFIAKRALGVVGEDRYADYGLDDPTASLVITRSGKDAKTYQVGGEAYGTRDLYVLDEGSGEVYLVDKNLTKPLKHAPNRMPDRELLGLEMGDVVALRVESADGARELEHRNRADPKASFFAAPGVEEKDDTFEAWLDKALALKSDGYVQADEAPTGLETAFTLQLATGNGNTVLVVSTGTDGEGETGWYASSEHTRGNLVKLHTSQASEASADLDAVFDEVELPEEE